MSAHFLRTAARSVLPAGRQRVAAPLGAVARRAETTSATALASSSSSSSTLEAPTHPEFAVSRSDVIAPGANKSAADKYKSKAMQRFWKDVSLKTNNEGNFELCLDGKSMRTPSRNIMEIPGDKPLVAYAVASEWEGQDKFVKKHSLPMTSLVVRSVDDFEGHEAYRKEILEGLLLYLHTDSVCYFQDFPESFVKMQDKYWKGLLAWVESECGIALKHTTSIQSVRQDKATIDFFRSEILKLDPLAFAAFEKGVLSTKSFVIPYALMHNKDYPIVDAAVAARLEQLHQIERWGEVEDAHDVERERLQRDMAVIRTAWI